jgi:hypothetical protein
MHLNEVLYEEARNYRRTLQYCACMCDKDFWERIVDIEATVAKRNVWFILDVNRYKYQPDLSLN